VKIKVNIWGCDDHFNNLSERNRHIFRTAIVDKFVEQARQRNLKIPEYDSDHDLVVYQLVLPIFRLYFADVILRIEDGEQVPDIENLYSLSTAIGELWDEFVRSLIDAGGFVGLRLICKDRQFRWSSEGRVVPEEKHTHTINP
jgi:hypothetical protein